MKKFREYYVPRIQITIGIIFIIICITEFIFTKASYERNYVFGALSFIFVIDGLRNIIKYENVTNRKIFMLLIVLELCFITSLGIGTIMYSTLKNTVEGFFLFIKIIVIIAMGFDIIRNVRKIKK